jgi:hypothetical protein
MKPVCFCIISHKTRAIFLVQAGLIPPWLSIALRGAIAVTAVMFGLGLGLSGLMRITHEKRDRKYGLTCRAATAPATLGILATFAS